MDSLPRGDEARDGQLLMEEPSRSDMVSRASAARRLPRRLRRCERGVGLIELLAVIPMLAATLMATYALYNIAQKSQKRTDNRAQTLIQQQVGFERMSRELRQATTVTPVSSAAIDVTTWVRPFSQDRSVKRRVRYECA